MLRLLCMACLACLALAPGMTARAQYEVACDGPLQGDELRFPHAHVAKRTWKDLAAVPASVVAWDAGDWSRFAAFTVPSVAMMLPPDERSLDVRMQRWVRGHKSDAADRFFVKIKTLPESVVLAVYGAVLFSTAYVRDDRRLFEYGTLALEALAVQQFFHITTKLLIGRESPYQGNKEGEIHGPTAFYFPGGTPSGHASTAYAMFAVLAEYYGLWPLHVLGQVAGLYISASLIYNNQHFVSDVLWGAGMGYYIGRWIVRHRSSRYRCKAQKPTAWYRRVLWLPFWSSTHGIGLGASYRY
jgi:membrane-associated phospholipid phosphatase